MQSIVAIFRSFFVLAGSYSRLLVRDIMGVIISSVLRIISMSVESVVFIVGLGMILRWSFVRFKGFYRLSGL